MRDISKRVRQKPIIEAERVVPASFPTHGWALYSLANTVKLEPQGRVGIHSLILLLISRKLVLKSGPSVLPSEAENMRFAAANTSIRVPKVGRSFNVPGPGFSRR
jgi:hypothetical protein